MARREKKRPFASDLSAASEKVDKLSFTDFLPALERVLTESQTPLTVGVYGPWGSGKTSMLKMLSERVQERRLSGERPVWFTAWKYDQEESLWRAFVLRVLDGLYPKENGERLEITDGTSSGQKEQIETLDRLMESVYEDVQWETEVAWALDKSGTALQLAKLPLSLALRLVGQGEVAKEFGFDPKLAEIINRQAKQQQLKKLESMEMFASRFEDAVKTILKEEDRLVVFVDDLDRCLPEKAVQVLEAIKLFLDVPQTVFVLGMDPNIVRSGIESHYRAMFQLGSVEGASPVDGDDYLQKIVQLAFNLPTMDEEARLEYLDRIDDELEVQGRVDADTRRVIAFSVQPNPRQIKRVLNTFRLLQEIAATTMVEISKPLLAKTVLIQTQWPEVYAQWQLRPTFVKSLEQEYRERKHLYSEEALLMGENGRLRPSAERVESEVLDDGQERAAHQDVPRTGLLASFLKLSRRNVRLRKLLLYDPKAPREESPNAHFQNLNDEQLRSYLRLAGVVTTSDEVEAAIPAPADILNDLASGDPARVDDALARLRSQEEDAAGPLHDNLRRSLLQSMREERRPARERVAAGNGLAEIGDPRFNVAFHFLPRGQPGEPGSTLGFIEIPKGPFVMGSREGDQGAHEDEFGNPEQMDLPYTYYIARWPVTVAQYRAFVEQGGYEDSHPDALRGIANHPVVRVSWRDGQRYCAWLTRELRENPSMPEPLAGLLRSSDYAVLLPSEAEWEKAARGDRRIDYPWGDAFDANRANTEETGIWATSPVGCFPGGVSSYGVEDLSGNAWEWTRSLYENYPVDESGRAEREQQDTAEGDPRALRGGSFYSDARPARCAARHRFGPHYRPDNLGFRVAVSPSSTSGR